jgi:RimJ/RimL family protein N-acetyltransferase
MNKPERDKVEIVYKTIQLSDCEAFYDFMNDKSLAINAGSVPHPITMEWTKERLQIRLDGEKDRTLTDRGLYIDGLLVGSSGYFFRDHGLEIGYAIHRDHRGKGLATKAARLAIQTAREHRHTGPICANYFKDNPISGRILEKLGFVVTGDQIGKSMGREGELPSWCTRLEGDIALVEFQDSDLEPLFNFQDDEEAQKLAGGGRTYDTLEDFTAFMQDARDKGAEFQTILQEGEPVGYIAAFDRFEKREISYWIGREFWGKGIGTKAVAIWLERFDVPSAGLYARVMDDHPASARVLEKNGFTVDSKDSFFSELRGEDVNETLYVIQR